MGKVSTFQKIEGIKKIIRCKSCDRKMEVSNFNRALCKRCGYRDNRTKADI